MPEMPNCPKDSPASGMKGDQLSVLMAVDPAITNTMRTTTLMQTTMRLKSADSCMPTTFSHVMAAMMTMAGTLRMPPVMLHSSLCAWYLKGACEMAVGRLKPMSRRREVT